MPGGMVVDGVEISFDADDESRQRVSACIVGLSFEAATAVAE
jgi:hypothetical protein